MFNRVLRCLTLTKKPLRWTARRNCRPAIEAQLSACDILHTSKRRFCTKVGKISEEGETQENLEKNVTISVSGEQLQAMMDSDPEMEKLYKVIQLEVEVMRQNGRLIPKELKPQHWLQLIRHETRSARSRYLMYLFKLEMTQENFRKKKELARIEREQKLQEHGREEVDQMAYRLFKNTIFLRIYDTAMNRFYHSRMMMAKIHGPEVIIDLGYDKHMTVRESSECAKQLVFLFAENRVLRDPFYITFCNVNKFSVVMEKFYRSVPNANEPDFPLEIKECSYTELYDKKKLVYLTPHCNTEMTEYEPDSIYIIGGMVDKTNNQPLSLAKAKKEGLRMAKFPLDKYLLWGSGSGKRLPLNHVLRILADIRTTGDWHKALKHVPLRKLERPLDQLQTGKVQFPPQTPSWVNTELQRKRQYVPTKTKIGHSLNTSYTFRDRQKKSS
ncbi:mitochondrial ribonuclease P protein 1 homolog [Neodiprion pinetum]|uniref:RNA (guanine-9-)-methyltransferase domain-containing protein 1 n=1 Tax=Neodiprion lecontei TaxID=441921 RepID=A0A6J0BEA2_NEOLC|nr:mitochondrial ribonuclease P protein 1 homolog [Neodiprion lecontei]XP_046492323.1 mitochondrial ribonuclease P protein 1 homolog [Neodiprion pinetum]XP_046627374.1 mitochondrial ribonuclease P protein 1 homolog [Neodiprion virginianus]